jgi:hypothetical protein
VNQKKAKQLRRILNQFAVKKEMDKPLKDIRVIVGYTFNEKGEESIVETHVIHPS